MLCKRIGPHIPHRLLDVNDVTAKTMVKFWCALSQK